MPPRKLLIHALTFPPDQVSTAYLYGDIAQKFISEGWEVEVFTTVPHYNYSQDFQAVSKPGLFMRTTEYHGIKVRHFYQSKSVSTIVRATLLLCFHFAFIIRALIGPKYSVVLTPSPPLTAGFLSGLAAQIRGAKAVYNIQEIYPDIMLKTGAPIPGFIWNLLKWIEKKTYDWSTKVVAIDPLFANVVRDRMPYEKLEVIPNFVDIELYKPTSYSRNGEFDFDGKFVVAYFGNLGAVQNWKALIEAMDFLKNQTEIMLLLVGGGSEYDRLTNLATSRDNITIMPYQPRKRIPVLMSRSNLHVISMNEASDHDGLPSKVLTILSSGKPVLAATSENSSLARLISECGNGTRVDRGDSKGIADQILAFFEGKIENLSSMKGREYIVSNYSKEAITMKYLNLLESLLIDELKGSF